MEKRKFKDFNLKIEENEENESKELKKEKSNGFIKIGRIEYKNGKKVFPEISGFKTIEVMTPSTQYGSLSPYSLKTKSGFIFENLWQFSKMYEQVEKSVQRYSAYDPKIIWDHPEEIHYKNGNPTLEYWNWRKKGFSCQNAVRYPVGRFQRTKCIGAIWNFELGEDENALEWKADKYKLIDYINARKLIYVPIYCKLVSEKPQFKELQKMLENGENLLIVEVDGPHQESLQYYEKKYSVSKNWIEENTIEASKENLEILLNDSKHPFGHGYCLAMSLLDQKNNWKLY